MPTAPSRSNERITITCQTRFARGATPRLNSGGPLSRALRMLLVPSLLVAALGAALSLPPVAGTGAAHAQGANSAGRPASRPAAPDAVADRQARIEELERELALARARIGELERALADATQKLRDAGLAPAPPVQAEPPADDTLPAVAPDADEQPHSANPPALLRALQSEYQLSVAPVGGWATPRERTIYFRTLEKWLALINRKLRAPIDWSVRVEAIGAVGDKNVEMRFVAIDPSSGEPVGDTFDVLIPTSQARRLESSGALLGRTIRLKGTLTPQARFNEQRESVGSFDSPPFIGPFCEFGFVVENPTALPLREA